MSEDQAVSKLAIILHADVVGSTALVRRDESLAHQRIQDTFRRLAEVLARHDGVAHEIRGDAVVAGFSRASDAVAAAVEFQTANSAYTQQLDDGIRPVVRIGIAMGEVVIADNTVTGEGVVLAQRLEQLADPAGICIQGAAHETLPGRLPFEYEKMGDHSLKGFDEPIRVVKVKPVAAGEPSGSAAPPRSEPSQPGLLDKPSIAVLPFTNMSGDEEQEYFSDGITEDIITALSHFSGLFVIARNSSFTYKGKAVDTRQVAAELGVRYVLEGSVRRAGNRLRISGQLINAETGNHIWAERFDGDLQDMFELQDEITRKIVGSIAPQIELAEIERGRGLQPASLSSYELSLKAKSVAFDAFRLADAQALQRAIDIANEALRQDPRNTQALWLLGMVHFDQYIYQWGDDPAASLERALQAIERLIHVDSSNAAGYALRGTLRTIRREFDLALPDYERSMSLNPNDSLNLFFAAWGESLIGHTELAREHAQLGIRLSPREMDLWMGLAYLALFQASFAEREFTEAIKWGRLAIQMHARAPIRRALMVACCAHTGNLQEAAHHADELRQFAPGFIPGILHGELLLYKDSKHNELLQQGFRMAGLQA